MSDTNFTYTFTCSRCGIAVPRGEYHSCGGTPLPLANSLPVAAPILTGWQCPVCKKGNAPWAATCGHCVFTTPTTYATGTNPDA